MKKMFVFALALIILMSFAGCELPPIESTGDDIGESIVTSEATEPTDASSTDSDESTSPDESSTGTDPSEESTQPSSAVDEDHTHSYVKTVVAPTCTEQGYTKYTCSCGDSYKEDYVKATGHDYQTSTVAPTCTEQGYTLTKCSRCGDASKSNYKPATGHNYQDTVVAPTCTEQGYTLHKCSGCNNSTKDHYTPALGHDMVSQGDNGQYTDKADGFYATVTSKCSRCNKTEQKETLIRRWDDFNTELIAQYICDYAIQKYGCTRDTSLNLSNGGYFFAQDAKGHSEMDVAIEGYWNVDDTFERRMYLDNMTFDEIYGWYRCNVIVVLTQNGWFEIYFIYG